MSDKRLLITGANGFVGAHLAEMASVAGYKVFAAVRKSSGVDSLHHLDVTLSYPDYADVDKLAVWLSQNRITHIAHVAGMTKGRSQQDYDRVNVFMTKTLATAALQAGISLEHFVYISSLAAMGPVAADEILTEESVCKPVTFYGKSKLAAENELRRMESLPYTILRPTAVFGPREKDMFILIKMIKRHWEFYIGKEVQRLSFIYVKDLCQAILDALTAPARHGTYILSDGNNYERYAFSNMVKAVLNSRTIKLHLPVGLVKMLILFLGKMNGGKMSILNEDKLKELTGSWACGIDRARHELNYIPAYNLERSLTETIHWYKVNCWL